MKKASSIYQKRINAVIDHLNKNLDQSFSLDELARIAHFSSFHFHKIFVAVVGESVNFYTNRVRLEKAAKMLKFSPSPIADIAYDCGFSSPSTFSRSFSKYFSVSPSLYRKKGHVENHKICKELFPMTEYLVPMTLTEKQSTFPVIIKTLPQRKVAYIRVVDSYQEGVVIEAFEKLITWAKDEQLFDDGQFFGMSLDDPMVTPHKKYRYEACITIPKHFSVDTDGIEEMLIPACSYVTTTVSGDITVVATGIDYLFNTWLINSEYEPEHQHALEHFLDKQNICNWDPCDLELCIPVKPISTF